MSIIVLWVDSKGCLQKLTTLDPSYFIFGILCLHHFTWPITVAKLTRTVWVTFDTATYYHELCIQSNKLISCLTEVGLREPYCTENVYHCDQNHVNADICIGRRVHPLSPHMDGQTSDKCYQVVVEIEAAAATWRQNSNKQEIFSDYATGHVSTSMFEFSMVWCCLKVTVCARRLLHLK